MENQNNKANAFQHKRQPQDTNKKRLASYLQTLSKFPEVMAADYKRVCCC